MNDIVKITEKIWDKQYEFSKHAVDQSIVRNISVSEIEEALTDKAIVI